ncbi:hypothetical protein OIU85_023175 [Salix viminalis]|uniref:Uncharacterized protein n=1 Tax=Salix viminalis TaxID=40686 RepID=A0A9Q0Z8L9_SALVM|nr:hypothetical protein OIU85_023175 [Salix viminalis]
MGFHIHYCHRKELADPDRDRAPLHSELKERNPLPHVDRDRLPCSPPLEQLDGNIERERKLLSGGARPREVVLKERGIDAAAMINHDFARHLDRFCYFCRNNSVSFNSVRTDTLPPGQRIVRKFERKDQQVDIERVEVQRRNWHNENWRNNIPEECNFEREMII